MTVATPDDLGRIPVPGEASELAERWGHDRALVYRRHDRGRPVVFPIFISRPGILDTWPAAIDMRQIDYTPRRCHGSLHPEWGAYYWTLWMHDRWAWVASELVDYHPRPGVPQPEYATAPLRWMVPR